MENIEVIAFENMHSPLLPRSLQCSTNLRTLCLYRCSLMHDISSIGNLSNLEVLSFAHSSIWKLPSAIGNLKLLKLLDLTGSVNLHIDDGVLQNLVELEELYMRVDYAKGINFTDANYNELAERSKTLSAMEIEFWENTTLSNNMFWKKLERFRISVGCYLKGNDVHSFEKTLMLCTNTDEILESKINELFEKAEVIHLQVDGMNYLEDVLLKPPQHSLFYHLRILTVLHCGDLRYLFTPGIATCLSKLERLTISSCPNMKVLIHSDNNETIKFQELKFLSLGELPELVSLCNTTSVIELPKLVELTLDGLLNFSSIYPENKSTSSMSNDVSAMWPFLTQRGTQATPRSRELVSLCNTTSVIELPKLVELTLDSLPNFSSIYPENKSTSSMSIDVSAMRPFLNKEGITRTSHVLQFNLNIFLVPQQQESVFYNLTKITLGGCNNIKYLLSPLAVKLLSNLKTIIIRDCDSFEEVVSSKDHGDEEMTTSTSTHTNTYFFPHFETLALRNLPFLKHIGGVAHDPLQIASWSLCQYAKRIDINKCNALSSVIPSYAVGQLQKLKELRVYDCESMLELFESQKINNCGDNSNDIGEGSFGTSTPLTILIPRMKTKPLVELCNLRRLSIGSCARLRYIFTCSTLESLKQLKELYIWDCKALQVIVKEEDGEQTTTTSEVVVVKEEDGVQTTTSKVVVLPHLQSISLVDLPKLKGFFMGSNEFQWPSLDEVAIFACPQMMVFTSRHSKASKLNYIHSNLGKHSLECGLNFHLTTTTVQETQSSSSGGSSSFLTSKGIPLSFSNLIEVNVILNHDLRNIIPFDELLKVKKLEKIYVEYCYEVVEVFEAFKGENSGLNESQSVVKFPELREVCLDMLAKLEYIWRNDRWTILEFPNLTSLTINVCRFLGHVFTCSMVDSLPKLQELKIDDCENMEVIVKEEEEEENRGKEVVFPCLKSLQLEHLGKLKGFSLGKEDFLWRSLHTLKIQDCPEITVFTNGLSTTPELHLIDTTIGGFYAEEGINAFIKVKKQEGYKF